MIRIKKCLRCNYEWAAHKDNPKYCPRCNSPYWNKPRTKAPTVMKIPKEITDRELVHKLVSRTFEEKPSEEVESKKVEG